MDQESDLFDPSDISQVLISQHDLIQSISLSNGEIDLNHKKEKIQQVCSQCGTTITSFWRRNKDGQFECNACNLYFRKNNRHRPTCLLKRGIMKRNRKVRINSKRNFNLNGEWSPNKVLKKFSTSMTKRDSSVSSNENSPIKMLLNNTGHVVAEISQMEIENNNNHTTAATATITATYPITSIKLEAPESISEFTTPTHNPVISSTLTIEPARPASQQSASNKSNCSTPFSDASPSSSNDTFNHHYAKKWGMDMKDKILKGIENGLYNRMPYSIGTDFDTFSKLFNVTTGEAVAIQCNLCSTILSPNALGQLGQHKNSCSKNLHPQKQETPIIQQYPINPQAKSTALQSVARLCVTDYLPFLIADSPGFKRFTDDVLQFGYMAGLNAAKNKSNFSAPTSNDFLPNGHVVSKYIGDCVNERLPVFVEFLKTNIRKHGASIAIDIPSNGSNLVGFTINFIDDSWRYHNYLLDLQEIDFIPQSFELNADLTKDALNRLLLRYGLFTENRNITLVISDPKMHINGFTNVNCVYSFLEELSNFIFWQKNVGDIQLAPEVKEELMRINTLIANLMDIVGVIRKRPELKNNLAVRFSHPFDSRSIIWKSCLERFLNLTELDYQSIRDILATHNTLVSKLGLLLHSRQILSLCITSIEPIHNLMKKYEKQSKPSLHMVIVDLMNLKKNYHAKANSDMGVIKAVGVAVIKFLDDKMDGFLDGFYSNAMILDPGHKNQLKVLIEEEKFQKARDHFKSSIYALRPKPNNFFAQEDLDSFDGFPNFDEDPIEQEIKTYLRLKKDTADGFPTILDFWKVNERLFPTISKLTRKTLCSPAASISSEEVYKVFTKSLTKGKNSIDCDTVTKIISTIFLQKFAQSMS